MEQKGDLVMGTSIWHILGIDPQAHLPVDIGDLQEKVENPYVDPSHRKSACQKVESDKSEVPLPSWGDK